jgi:hypothetical protein
MNHFASPDFWFHYRHLPQSVQDVADKNFDLLRSDSSHPSLRFKKVGDLWSVRVGLRYRALAMEHPSGLIWFWIGDHAEYETLIS